MISIAGTPRQREAAIRTIAENAGYPISRAKANRLMKRSLSGEYDPTLSRILCYADPTGEQAVNNVIRAGDVWT